jgi:hypothetical protein
VYEELIVRIRDYLRIIHTLRTDPTLRREIPGLPHDIDNGIAEIKWKRALTRCYRVLLEEYGPDRIKVDSEPFQITLTLLEELAKGNGGELHIFTTNYDCSYQVLAANTTRLKVQTHIDNESGRFKDHWFSVRPELASSVVPSVYVHRLHGCVAWFTASPGEDDTWLTSGAIEEVYGAGRRLTIKDDDYLHNMCIKLIAAQMIGANPVFATAFEEFSRHLRTCSSLFVWGYSFRDIEVLRLINHAVSTRPAPLRIVYLDPYLPEDVVIQNIRRTFQSIPIQVAPELRPHRIDWRPPQGYPQLVRSVVNETKKGE